MQISSRFTVALHIFTCVATFKDEYKVTSDFLADSIGTNPVIIRKILTQLQGAGLITVARGTGGISPTRELSEISFYDVYQAIDPVEDGDLFRFHENPSPQCPVGKNIHALLDGKLKEIQSAMENEMKKYTIADLRMEMQDTLDSGKKITRMNTPNPNTINPIAGYDREIYVKPTIKNPNIIVGDFTYIADSEFESHVTNFYPWSRDKLIIGKFCQIAAGVEFVMNDANHQMNAVTTFPFYTLDGWHMKAPEKSDMPFKGDTVIGNDVWIGQNAVILPGVNIGDGAIIGANSVVGSRVAPYTIVAGNPAKLIRKRFDDELIELMLSFKWWDKSIDEINALIPLLTSSNLEMVKSKLR